MYGIYIDKDEALQIAISVFSISLALGIVFAGVDGMLGYPREFLLFLAPLVVTVGSGFILHEMAHKLVAIYYGAQARFRMWTQGLLFMLATSAFGILFAAPGAVYIYSNTISRRQNGIISLAGPALNIALAFFFIILQFVAPINQFFSFLLILGADFGPYGIGAGILQVWRFGAAMNIMLALFNMIPAFPLDGSKVFAWSMPAWIAAVGFLLLVGAAVISPGIVIGWGIMLVIFGVLSKLLFG
ncbi:site-2 protease family protein [Candidatus Micrarchaeota archaeon]|nr:site-2 protease family protein [Candidatus Micrarchaeota archaeon]